ncbi:MAG TPA: hypothetical protein VFY13_05740 [Luteolibacter sp.]|nr:hypothetical protein [Luteolibacter sp.]
MLESQAMKKPPLEKMGWTGDAGDTLEDIAIDLATSHPSGGWMKQWLLGMVLAAPPVVLGAYLLLRGVVPLYFGSLGWQGVTGPAAHWLAVSVIAVGAFIHFHYFWGLSDRLWSYSMTLKVLAFIAFLASFLYALFLLTPWFVRMMAG